MSEYLERTFASKPTFGDYVTIEMKCYGVPNEHFIHEVLSSPFTSNSWREVPIKAGDFEEQLHDTRETVIAVRTQGLNSRDGHIFAVRLADVLPMKGADWSWRESPLRSRIIELEGEINKMKAYFHKPTHGPCCTCQKCGHSYDECRCDFDETYDENDALKARIAELEGLVDQLIEAGDLLAECSDYEGGKIAWDALVKDWKERER